VAPTRQHLKGEPRSKRNPASSVFEESVWLYQSPLPDTSDLHAHLEHLVNLLESRVQEMGGIRDRLRSVDIFCMFSSENGQGSAELSSGLIRRLGECGVDLIIDLYPPQ
jgi:hypothetical protein